jgi:hypothetical protein
MAICIAMWVGRGLAYGQAIPVRVGFCELRICVQTPRREATTLPNVPGSDVGIHNRIPYRHIGRWANRI